MRRVFILCNAYDEMPNLPVMWESVLSTIGGEVVPDLVVIDGKYPDYDVGAHDLSTDGTREWAEDNGHLLTCIDYECEKRTAGLRFIDTLAVEGDYILYLDADEEITGFFGYPSDVGIIAFAREHGNVTYDRARMYAWRPGLEFRRRHYELWLGDDLIADLGTPGPNAHGQVVGLGIHHNKAHSPQRFAIKRTYYRDHLKPRESDHAAV